MLARGKKGGKEGRKGGRKGERERKKERKGQERKGKERKGERERRRGGREGSFLPHSCPFIPMRPVVTGPGPLLMPPERSGAAGVWPVSHCHLPNRSHTHLRGGT